MKKPKISLNGEAVKGFFTYHVEKLILVVVIGLVGLFVMWGYQLEGYTAYTPDAMKSDAEAARNTMTRPDVWNEPGVPGEPSLKDDPTRDTEAAKANLQIGVGEGGKLPPIPKNPLRPDGILNLPLFAPNAKRADPQLFAAMEVEVEAGYGPLAMPNRAGVDPADPKAGMDPLMKAATAYQEKLQQEAQDEAERNQDRDNPGGGLLDGGRSQFQLAPNGRMANEIPLTDEQREALSGFQPQGAGAGAGVAGVMPRGLNYVAVTALAPYKKQFEEYEAVLKDSAGYDLGRDSPQYVWFIVQRAEVDASGQPGAWTSVGDPAKAYNIEQYYAGTATDLVDPRYKSPALTMSVPPIMLRDLTDLSVHSKTPLISLEEDVIEAEPDGPIFTGEQPANGTGAPTITPDMLNQQRPGGGRGPGGVEGGRNPYGGGVQPRIDPLGGREGQRGGEVIEEEMVDYQLVRFFDFTVQPGKEYVYRVQLWVSDPNHPQDPAMTPPPSLLQEDVIARISALDRAYAAAVAKDPGAARTSWREADWSEPSKPVSVPKTWTVLAGEMEPTKKVRIRLPNGEEASFEMPGEEPKAKSMAITWSPGYAADIPGETDIYRGSVLNFKSDVNVLHPPSTTVVTLPDYKFTTNAIVLDMDGGETLPGGDRKNPLLAPTEVLVIDSEGNMFVRNELDDKREYRLNKYEKPPEPEPSTLDPGNGLEPGRGDFGDPLFGGERGRGPGRGRGG